MVYLNLLYSIPSEPLERCKSWKIPERPSGKDALNDLLVRVLCHAGSFGQRKDK